MVVNEIVADDIKNTEINNSARNTEMDVIPSEKISEISDMSQSVVGELNTKIDDEKDEKEKEVNDSENEEMKTVGSSR